jgi:hypothetical protein
VDPNPYLVNQTYPAEVQSVEQSSHSARLDPIPYTFKPINIRLNGTTFLFDTDHRRPIYQAPAWLAFLSETQNGEPIVAA